MIIEINITHHAGKTYYLDPIFVGLLKIAKKYNFLVKKSNSIPNQSIAVNGKLVAFISYQDWYHYCRTDENLINKYKYPLIFKYQYDPNLEGLYGYNHQQKTVCAGYVYPVSSNEPEYPNDILTRERTIQITARMRDHQNISNRKNRYWSKARKLIMESVKRLGKEGYEVTYMKEYNLKYYNDLLNTKIGCNWRGIGYLNHRIIEYLKYGVVLLTQPLGDEHPIREDVILEDGITCVFCNHPSKFYKEAKLLLKDKKKIKNIRANAWELWKDTLSLEAMGEFYYKKLMEVINEL